MSLSAGLGGALAFAATNHHLLTTRTLRGQGLADGHIALLVRHRVLERIVRGLYRVPGSRTPTQDIAAAVSRHRHAVTSHTSALYLHKFDVRPPRRPHLTLPVGATSATSLGQLHRSPLAPTDRTVVDGIAVVSVARALVDASEQLSPEQLARMLGEAFSARRCTVADIAAAIDRVELAPGRAGLGRLRTALGRWTEALQPESPAEAAVLRRILDDGLPMPETQFEIRDETGRFVARVDLAWPDERVMREYDSDRFHGPDRIEQDELRRQRLEALGWTTGVIHRGHLLPSRTDWLRSLRKDLRRPGRVAS